MAIINSYPTATPTGSDLIIGTDVSTTPNSTKTFTIDSINALSTGYTTYVARVTQASTAAPVATIIANNTGLTFTWARTGPGAFTVTPSSAFVVNKTWIQMTGGDVSTGVTMVTVKSITTAFATAVNSNLINGAAADGITAAFVEIRIYPQ